MTRTVLLGVALLGAPLWAQNPSSPANNELELQPGSGWNDTGIDLQPGDSLHFDVTGALHYSNAKQYNGPEGLSRGFADIVRDLPFNDSGRGAAVGRIGSSDADRAFLIGRELDKKAPIAGRLFVGINERKDKDKADGSFHVTIVRTAAAVTNAAPVRLPDLPQSVLDSVPLRVTDKAGGLGDRVNFILIGSNSQVQAMLKAAGWVQVDASKNMLVQSVRDSISKEAYVTLPMSHLYLFGRTQDYGYAQGDPVRVVASRHHFRLWRAPFQLEGQDVWIGAGTHDIGFDRDRRDDLITHKIDPNTDNERDYIRDNLTQTGMVLKTSYMTPTDPIMRAKTATGEEFYSDGRTLLIYLTPPAPTN